MCGLCGFLPIIAHKQNPARYAKGFPLEDTTIESVSETFTSAGHSVLSVRLRRLPTTKAFKGSAFVEFDSPETAATVVAGDLSVSGNKLVFEPKEAYVAFV